MQMWPVHAVPAGDMGRVSAGHMVASPLHWRPLVCADAAPARQAGSKLVCVHSLGCLARLALCCSVVSERSGHHVLLGKLALTSACLSAQEYNICFTSVARPEPGEAPCIPETVGEMAILPKVGM